MARLLLRRREGKSGGEREREVQPAYTYLAYSMIGRRLITIEIGSRVAIPTRVTAPARASTCIIKFTVILIHGRPPPPPPSSLFSLRAFRFPAVRANFPYLSARDGRKTKGISKGMENANRSGHATSNVFLSRIRDMELHRHSSRRNSRLLGCSLVASRAIARKRDVGRGGFLSRLDVKYTPDTRSRC